MKKRLLSFAIAICMIFSCAAVLPEGAFDDFIALFTNAQELSEDKEIHQYKEINYNLNGVDDSSWTYLFTYRDDMFNINSNELSTDLAKMSVGLALAAYDPEQISSALDQMKFKYTLENYDESIRPVTYEDNDFVAYSIASKTTTFNGEQYNIVLVPIRGTHGDPEWFSDFNLGTGDDHKGFYLAADEILENLKLFLENNNKCDSDHTIILTTGHSRGAAVANIVAGTYTTKSGYNKYAKKENIFAYTFACPSVSRNADTSLLNIYNYNNCGDIIPALPLEEWGFKRYGRSITLQARGIEYENFLQRFKNQFGMDYVGMSDTTLWLETFRMLASDQDEYNTPENKMLFGIVCAFLGPGQYDRMDLLGKVLNDYLDAKGITSGPFFLRILHLFQEIYNICKTVSSIITVDPSEICSAGAVTGLTFSLSKIDTMITDTSGLTQEEFESYIGMYDLYDIEIETGITISTRNDLISARRSIVEAMNMISSLSAKIDTIINLFFAAKNDPNSNGSLNLIKVITHGHTGDTYVLWINSLYYGYRGWYSTDISPNSLPDNITTLGYECFCSNNSLESVDIPVGVKYISSCSFDGCSNLKQISIPYTIDVMGGWAFHNCTGLESVSMPCEIPQIGLLGDETSYYPCFRGCTNVKSIHYTYGRTGIMRDLIGSYEFNYSIERESYKSLTTVSFDEGITHIGKSYFSGVASLSSVKLPAKLKSIGEYAFSMCTSLKHIELPEPLETLGNNCFQASGLEDIKIPSKLTVIPQDCFSSCANLTSLVIPETVTKIKGCAFDNCIGLRNVTIACDLPTIGTWGDENSYYPCFSGCSNVNTIHYTYGKTGKMIDSDGDRDLQHQAGESLKTVEFDDNITHIGNLAFNYVTSLSSIKLPVKLKSIGEYAFRMCTSLKHIELPEPLETLGNNCFQASGLEDIKIPSKLTVIPQDCFSSCANLTSLVIPETVTKLKGCAFNYCTGLKSVTIACDLPTIGTWGDENSYYPCFSGCSNVNTIHYTYGKTGKMIDSDGDRDLQHQVGESLKTVEFDDNITHIGNLAFNYVTSLSSVKLPAKLKSIGEYAFRMCTSLKRIELPESLETLGSHCFENSAIEELRIPSGISSIPDSFANECASLSKLYIPISVTSVGYSAFHNCNKLETVVYNGHLEDWNKISIEKYNEPLEKVQCIPCEHNYEINVTTPVTCTTDGVETHTCSKCNDSFTKTIKATGHIMSVWAVTTEPTCATTGVETRKCENCDKTETRELNALGHDYVETVVAPTCTTKGYTNHKCSRCGDEYNDSETSIVDHTYGDWDIKSYDSNTGESKLERKCINCTHTETKTEKDTVQRYAGSGRFATAAEISKGSFETAKTVVLAYGLNSADALAGVPLAAKYNAPILLTNTKTLPQETLAEIKRLKATNVIILGGEGAIGKDVENLLKKEGLTTQRIAGKTRFGTATAIAEQLNETPEEIFFVYAFNFADALSASTVAAVKGAPIIYLKTNGVIDADTAAYLAKVKGKVKKAYVIGGTGVISNDMMNKAKNALGLDTITRVAGANRYATCIEVNNTFKDYLTGSGICVAKGLDFPDALAGGVFAALKKMPLFLADGSLKDVQTSYLGNKDISNVYVFGGTGAVPDDLIEKLAKAS